MYRLMVFLHCIRRQRVLSTAKRLSSSGQGFSDLTDKTSIDMEVGQMKRNATDERELADAINSGADEIEIEGYLRAMVFKIKAKGKVAWLIAFGA